ncbi:EAL domain-containing protein [Janthinobacterium sp. NKUCC06_STL]|uniref:EAL domain-containing protein n=1 Tax=Janthinobacterium sp. NKUCC06_STL TaxID=2842127 RepID=UPI001C5B46B3|nr:EAL domain-containing protein [Janthinobacterium sp. NKUCC06_STL]MBW3512186.1 EAL domain-containing protein [Janthinobacterium sp. NKUCC06_STL]
MSTSVNASRSCILEEAYVVRNTAMITTRNRVLRAPQLVMEKTLSRLPTDADAILAITSGEGLRMVYRPQYDLNTRCLNGAEAQLRWHHPSKGVVPLSELTLIVRRLNLDALLFNFVITQAIDVLCRMRDFDANISLTVSTSVRTIGTPGIARLLSNRMSRAGLPPRLLKIEVRENLVAFEAPHLRACLDTFRMKGFSISLDVIDGGAATLKLLSHMPFEEVKVNGALSDGKKTLALSPANASTAFSQASLRNLKIPVCGIESDLMIAPLRDMDFGAGQCNVFGCPLERADFLKSVLFNSTP